jgi:hypothetical protein
MMKKSRAYLIGLILLLVVAIMAPFFIPGPKGKPLMTFDRMLRIMGADFPIVRQAEQLRQKAQETAREVREKVGKKIKTEESETADAPIETHVQSPPETLYKWRDKSGTWHFTNRPPPDGVDYKVVKWEGATKPAPNK